MADTAAVRDALHEAILGVLKDAAEYSGSSRSEMVRDAAMAFRFVTGGPQPGGAIPPKD